MTNLMIAYPHIQLEICVTQLKITNQEREV